MLRLMEDKQLIRRTVSGQDRRLKTIELLDKGYALQRKCGPIRAAIETQLAAGLSPREVKQFKSLCCKLLAHLE